MRLDLKWRTEGEETSEHEIAVVADVLRASTTIITALSLGATEITPFGRIEAAVEHGRGKNAVLIGQCGLGKPDGFDFGNSPSSLDGSIRGKTISFTSTNFPKALAAAKKSPHILIGALVNATAVCEKAYGIAASSGLDICLMLAGQKIEPRATEELIFAGICGERLKGRCDLTRRMLDATDHIRKHGEDILQVKHAIELFENGFAEDVGFANRRDMTTVVPCFKNGRISALA